MEVPSSKKSMEQYRKTPRANWIDYDNGSYFVTICTKDWKHFFGEIREGKMYFSEIGKFVDYQLKNAGDFNKSVEIPLYVVMPNHIHMIVCIIESKEESDIIGGELQDERNPNSWYRADSTCQRHVPTLSRYVNTFKGVVTKFARENNIKFNWQARYHDHYIRNYRDQYEISKYIEGNVFKWKTDCYF